MELKSLSHTHTQLLVDALTTLGLLRCYGLEFGSPKAPSGFEPTTSGPSGLEVRRLNHSAMAPVRGVFHMLWGLSHRVFHMLWGLSHRVFYMLWGLWGLSQGVLHAVGTIFPRAEINKGLNQFRQSRERKLIKGPGLTDTTSLVWIQPLLVVDVEVCRV
ncbi:hypothetical protein ACOMHN_058785 [Nucella lapillus]